VKGLPTAARTYWGIVVAAATAALAGSLSSLVVSAHTLALHDWLSMAAFAGVALVGESMSIPLVTFGEDSASHSIGSVAAVAGIIVLPLYAAIPLIPLAMFWTERRANGVKSLFNIAESTLSVAVAGLVFHLIGAVPALTAHNASAALHALAAMLAMAITYYCANNGLVAIMVALASNQRVRDVYHANHWNTVLQEATAIGLGLILGGLWLYNVAFAPFVALPVVMAYFSIDTFVRIQQETRNAVLEMAKSIDLRDSATHMHSQRVAKLSVALAKELQLSHEQIANIELSSLVHDIGKIGIPNEILNKPGKLTVEERNQMEAHPVIGYEMLRHYKQFRKGLGIVRWHHERWDGVGYPDAVPGPQVPIEARIVSVADAFEAMTADRPYRKAMPAHVAYGRLEAGSGTQFDPELVGPFRHALISCGEMSDQPILSEDDQDVQRPPLRSPIPVMPEAPAPSPVVASPIVTKIRPVRERRSHQLTRIQARQCGVGVKSPSA
jgi:hypothetical protein